jgi:hypothetical protein
MKNFKYTTFSFKQMMCLIEGNKSEDSLLRLRELAETQSYPLHEKRVLEFDIKYQLKITKQ